VPRALDKIRIDRQRLPLACCIGSLSRFTGELEPLLLLAVSDLGAHPAFLPTYFAPALTLSSCA
jgi:hypothetical protein